jgi:hypothetical protein
MKRNIIIFSVLIFIVFASGSCKKFLDKKPDQKMVVPSTLQDVQAILDNPLINLSSPHEGETAADNYYVTYANYNSLGRLAERQLYIWDPNADLFSAEWSTPYQQIFYANQALATLEKIPQDAAGLWKTLRGTAVFARSFYFYQLAQVFAPAYDATNATTSLGIPIRLTPDVNEPTTRPTVKQTYDQIVNDFLEAAQLLPTTTAIKSRPNKAAAYAMLARTYLAMADYTNALTYANLSLQQQNALLNFNQLNAAAAFPIARFNTEVSFGATSNIALIFNPAVAKVDSNLYKSYDPNDLRRQIFFKKNADDSYAFKGSYDGSSSYNCFTGTTTDEMYLVRAECYARAGNIDNALSDLNTLMQTRWKSGTFAPFTAASADAALSLILTERRKELVFRALRWTDLRRLNKEQGHATTLTRTLNGITYTLPSNDLRYTFLIPSAILARVDLPQNPR